jgi:glycosyltransferase involved in cell wall biosynthesis
MKILAVIPAYNEAAAIAPVAGAVNVLGYDVLVVDDGSSDSTAELAKVAGAIVLSTGRKSGKGNALRQGFGYAIGHGYDAVITLDGDGQHAPSDIRKFIEGHKATGAGIVNGNRMHDPKGMPALRLVTNAFMSWLISVICRQHVPDTQCGFKFVTTEVLKAIELECCGFEIETEMLIKASKKGFKISSVPVETIYRDEKSKIQPFKDTVRFMRYITKEAFKK